VAQAVRDSDGEHDRDAQPPAVGRRPRGRDRKCSASRAAHPHPGIEGQHREIGQDRADRGHEGAERSDGDTLLEDAEFRERIADVELDLIALDATILRIVAAESSGKPPGAEASLLKIKGSELQQALTELLIEAVGYYGFPYNRDAMEHGWNEPPIGPDYAAPLAPAYFNTRKTTIYGGSNEVQRGILAKFVMGF